MNCLNCGESLKDQNNYCPNCGAKIIRERMTTKQMWSTFSSEFFGFDNQLFKTIKELLTRPEVVLKAYIEGVRKRYFPPFAFLALMTSISLIVITIFSKQYDEINKSVFEQSQQLTKDLNQSDEVSESTEDFQKIMEGLNNNLLKYWTILSFLFLPVYTLIAYWVFGKPYNYGEHLVINSYIHGLIYFLITLLLLFAIVFKTPNLYFTGTYLALIIYYLFAYGRLYQLTWKQYLMKILKFSGILILLGFILLLIGVLSAILSNK